MGKGGVVNRFVSLPYEGLRRPPEQQVSKDAQEPPRELVAKLKLLPKFPDLLDRNIDGLPTPLDVPWGPGASERYIEFSREMDKNEQNNPQRYDLGMRVCENSARFATNIAVGRFSPTVDLEDITHAIAICKLSYEAMVGGIASYMREYFEFPDFCNKVAEEFRQRGGFLGQTYPLCLSKALAPGSRLSKKRRLSIALDKRDPWQGAGRDLRSKKQVVSALKPSGHMKEENFDGK